MKNTNLAFIPGNSPAPPGPLSRFLPPLPEGMATNWLTQRHQKGDLLLDPFGASPDLAIQAAQAGYRVLVAANNPILRFLYELESTAPTREELIGAFSELASAKKGEERLEKHIQSLYQSYCPNCKQSIQIEFYLWKKGEAAPFAKWVDCPFCKERGEFALDDHDQEILQQISGSGLHRARALERVAELDDPIRLDVQEALDSYLPRPLYVISTLINKIEGLHIASRRKNLLTGLIIHACDSGNTLWAYPTSRPRPKQLNIPSCFRENNLWNSLEHAINEFTSAGPAVSLQHWPKMPPQTGGITLFEGRMKELVEQVNPSDINGVLTVIPRQNQAFWTLSALWTGWIWGKEAVTPLRSVLTRRRYDWSLYASAIQSTIKGLQSSLPDQLPVFFLIPELEGPFISAVTLAGSMAGLEYEGLAIQDDQHIGQISWRISSNPKLPELNTSSTNIRAIVETLLQKRAEPTSFLLIQAAIVSSIINQPLNHPAEIEPVHTIYTRIQTDIQNHFSSSRYLTRFGGGEHSFETNLWWKPGLSPSELPISDRVEIELVRHLLKYPGIRKQDIDSHLCRVFPGLLTPTSEFIQACLQSYAIQEPENMGQWQISSQDIPSKRKTDILEINQLLRQIGKRLNFKVNILGSSELEWVGSDNEIVAHFYLIASSIVSSHILSPAHSAKTGYILFPGSRVNLLLYKLNHDPRLKEIISAGWHLLKFRTLRRIADNPLLNIGIWEKLILDDPPEYQATQMVLF